MVAPVMAGAESGIGSGQYQVNVPAGTQDGDLLICAKASDWGTLANNQVPTEFTPLTVSPYDGGENNVHIALGYRVASTEPASYNFQANSGADSVGAIIRVTGADTSTAIREVAAQSGLTAPSIVPATPEDLLLTFHVAVVNSGGERTWEPPPGMTEIVDRQSDVWCCMMAAGLEGPTSPSGGKTATISAGVDKSGSSTISIAPLPDEEPPVTTTHYLIQDGVLIPMTVSIL